MTSRAAASTALVVALNLLLFFTLVSSTSISASECYTPSPPKSPPPPPPKKSPPPPPPKKSPPPPPPKKSPPPPAVEYCPLDTLKLGVCSNVLGLINFQIGKPPKEPCCSLLEGLGDLEVAVCLCTALKANILGINLNIPINLSLLVNYCGKSVPTGFQCPP